MEKIGPKSVLEWTYGACHEAHRVLNVAKIETMVAVLGPIGDLRLADFCEKQGLNYWISKCKEDDLLERYREAIRHYGVTHVLRITGDCWHMHPEMICNAIALLKQRNYVCNTIQRTFMEGLDVQGASKEAFDWFYFHQKEKREHPFYLFDKNEMVREEFEKAGFTWTEMRNPHNLSEIKTSIDTDEELERARGLYESSQKPRSGMDQAKPSSASPGISGHEQQTMESIR